MWTPDNGVAFDVGGSTDEIPRRENHPKVKTYLFTFDLF